jgi:hypothetical protein
VDGLRSKFWQETVPCGEPTTGSHVVGTRGGFGQPLHLQFLVLDLPSASAFNVHVQSGRGSPLGHCMCASSAHNSLRVPTRPAVLNPTRHRTGPVTDAECSPRRVNWARFSQVQKPQPRLCSGNRETDSSTAYIWTEMPSNTCT